VEEREEYLHSLLRHDLGNKLQAVYGYLQLLGDLELPGKAGKYLGNMKDSVQSAVELMRRVGELREAEEERERVRVDLNLAIQNAIEETSAEAEEKGIRIYYNGRRGGMVEAIPLLINAFTNLIQNSIRHADCKNITITLHPLKDQYRIVFRDDGRGIPSQVKGSLFQRGVRGIGSTGSGLGLHLVKKIIDASDGKIQLKETEKGTRFDIHLKKAGV